MGYDKLAKVYTYSLPWVGPGKQTILNKTKDRIYMVGVFFLSFQLWNGNIVRFFNDELSVVGGEFMLR